jgi:hypothetical protein
VKTGIAFAFALCAAASAAAAERPVLRYVPKHEELKYTFGGVPPVAPPTVSDHMTRPPD